MGFALPKSRVKSKVSREYDELSSGEGRNRLRGEGQRIKCARGRCSAQRNGLLYVRTFQILRHGGYTVRQLKLPKISKLRSKLPVTVVETRESNGRVDGTRCRQDLISFVDRRIRTAWYA